MSELSHADFMNRRLADDDDDWNDPDDDTSHDDLPTVPCPYCSREIFEAAPKCPYCGEYISEEDATPSRKPLWIVMGVLVCLYIVYRWSFP